MWTRFTDRCVEAIGSPWAFLAALVACLVWGAAGPLFGWGDTWQLVINTATTILTFLMLFVLQHSQNRDTAATHEKLDLLLRAGQLSHGDED